MKAVWSQLCYELKWLYYTWQQVFKYTSWLLATRDSVLKILVTSGAPCSLVHLSMVYAIHDVCDFRYQALPLFSVQHWKGGKGLETSFAPCRLSLFLFINFFAQGRAWSKATWRQGYIIVTVAIQLHVYDLIMHEMYADNSPRSKILYYSSVWMILWVVPSQVIVHVPPLANGSSAQQICISP